MTPSSHEQSKKGEKALIEEDKAALRDLNKDSTFFQENYEVLLSQYPEQWVSIFKQKVAGVSGDMDALLHELRRKGIPLNQVLFEYMTEEETRPVVH